MSSLGYPTIPGYTIIKPLGQGGMATVYEAIQENFKRRVALKIMFSEAHNKLNDERFLSEARMVASLSHPNIITVYDVGQYKSMHYIAMELHLGGHLGESKNFFNLSHQKVLSICLDIAKALHIAHHHGIIHRDLKPDNILFSQHGYAVLTDFGIARDVAVDTHLTQVGLTVGTPKYMSPEQARGLKVDGRSDLYSLGIMMYELLTGHVPFDDPDPLAIALKHCKEPAKPLPMAAAKYQSIVDRLIMKSVDQRFQTAADLVKVLERFLSAASHQPTENKAIPPEGYDALPNKQSSTQNTVANRNLTQTTNTKTLNKTNIFLVEDVEKGNFFSKSMTKDIVFNAEDMDAFNKKFQKASDIIGEWHKQHGKKAITVNFSVEAHPWIHKRILDRFTSTFDAGHGYGDFRAKGTVTLHLYDQVNPTGKKYLLSDKGKR